jgi:hypothetical protein
MKIISTCLFLLLYGFAFSQFNRTFMHANWSAGTASFANYSYYDSQNKVVLCSAAGSGMNVANIVTQHISVQGDLESFDQQEYAINLPGAVQYTFLLTAIEQGNDRYYVLGAGSALSMKLVWLKVDKTTGTLISTITSTDDYKTSYFEPKLIGNELVTYVVKSTGGLVRIALNAGTFTTPSEELVSASITTAASFGNTMTSGFKSGNLFVVNGVEKAICGAGISSAVIFTRTAANSYTSVNTGITTQRSVSSFLINPTTIGVTNGITIEHYDAAGAMTNSGSFSWSPNSISSQIEYVDNQYHLYYKYTSSNKGIFLKTNQTFQIVDSVSTNVGIYHMLKSTNGMLLVGSDVEKGLSIDLSGDPSAGRVAYCEAYKIFPVLRYDEYRTLMQTNQNLDATIGLGTKVITSPYGLPGSTYDGLSACYNLTEHFVGFAGANDVLSNSQSIYNEQYDELPGPYTTSAMYDEILEAKYNRPYHVSLQMIQDHIDSVAFGSSSYVPVWEIRNWPAHGNTTLGQASNLAPFVDNNSNGIYEPLLGDYPRIYGNDCVFSLTHYRDNGNTNTAIEFHSYVYTQLCDTNETFNNVLMRKVKVFSRGAEIDSLFFGGSFDGDLGNYNDDYAGTNVELGLAYNYNADLMDEDNSGRKGYHDTLAAQGIMVLKGFKQADDGLDNGIGILPGQSVNGYGFNDGIIDNEYAGLYSSCIFTGTNAPVGQSDPVSTTQWYNMLNGLWQFGDQIYYGGTGFTGSPCVSSVETNYMYPANSDPLNWGTGGVDPGFEWSEYDPCGTGSTSNPGGDRRTGYSFGKTALSNGEFVELDYAYLIKRQNTVTTAIFEPVTDLFAKASAVRSAFLSNDGPCGINFDPIPVDLGVEESTLEGADLFTLYPNPTTGFVRISGISEAGGTIQIFDINGKLLKTVTNYQAMQNLDLSELEGNMFIFQISNESKTAQKRVVKY